MIMKNLKKISALVAILSAVSFGNCAAKVEPVDLVYPHLDTVNSRWFFFSSACRPFGMVNLSPDTETGGAWGSGYRYNTHEVKGFSHIHAWQLAGVSVMPVVVADTDEDEFWNDYYSAFSHQKEVIHPGYHKLELDRYRITAELTSTLRVGLHKYTFPANSDTAFLLNLSGRLGPSDITGGFLEQTSPTEIRGYLVNEPTKRRPKKNQGVFLDSVRQNNRGHFTKRRN